MNLEGVIQNFKRRAKRFKVFFLFQAVIEERIQILKKRKKISLSRVKQLFRHYLVMLESFEGIGTYEQLGNPRVWQEAHHRSICRIPVSSKRVFREDLTKVRQRLVARGLIKPVFNNIKERHICSRREEVDIGKVINLTLGQLQAISLAVKKEKETEPKLLFFLMIYTCVSPKYLLLLPMAGIGKHVIEIKTAEGIIQAPLYGAIRSMIYEHLLTIDNIRPNDLLFPKITTSQFSKWLKHICRQIGIGEVGWEELFQYAKFLRMLFISNAVLCALGKVDSYYAIKEDEFSLFEEYYVTR